MNILSEDVLIEVAQKIPVVNIYNPDTYLSKSNCDRSRLILMYSGPSCASNLDMVCACLYTCIRTYLGARFAKEWLWHSFDYIKGLFSTQAPCDRLSQ